MDGRLNPVEGGPTLTGDQIRDIARPLLSDGQWAIFIDQKDVDFAFSWMDRARIRGSLFTQKGEPALSLRVIPSKIPDFETLGLPAVANWVAAQPRGFVLVTGPTGSGKSTTLASIVDRINSTRAAHILTIEDPVEYVHRHRMSAVTQREIGLDSPSFDRALRSALREDPDVLLIGEMRDIDSIQLALTMAETGHLVFATLHTNDAPQAIDRIIDVFPAGEKPMVRSMLSESLRAVISQSLLKKVGGGRIAAHEIMVGIPAIRNLIREDKVAQMYSSIQTGQQFGMQTLDQTLLDLVKRGLVTRQEASTYAKNKDAFK